MINGVITKFLFRDNFSNSAVIALKPNIKHPHQNTYGTIVCKGIFPSSLVEGIPISVSGNWEADKKGEYLAVSSFELITFTLQQAIDFFNRFDINANLTTEIYKACNGAIYSVNGFKNEATETLSIISRECKDIMLLVKAGVSYTTAIKAIRIYGEIEAENIYKIGQALKLPLDICDNIYLNSINSSKFSGTRINGHAMSAIKQAMSQGNCYIYADSLLAKLNHSLGFRLSLERLITAIKKEDITVMKKGETSIIYCTDMYNNEIALAKHIKRVISNPIKLVTNVASYIDKIEKEHNIKYSDEQRSAFKLLQSSGIKILTGGAGVGKTSTVNGLLYAYSQAFPDKKIVLCSPTGRASQKLCEATGREASTIHRLLDCKVVDGEEIYRENPLDADFIVCDEASMLDSQLATNLLKVIEAGKLLLFVGDIAQLQSVGAGAVLEQLLYCKQIPVCRLTKTFRQSEQSNIIKNARRILEGNPVYEEGEDFKVITLRDNQSLTQAVVNQMEKWYNEKNPFDMQALSPVRKGDGGIYEINSLFQSRLQKKTNKAAKSIKIGGQVFRVGDKVILLKNNVTKGYYNGDIGIIKEINYSIGVIEVLINDNIISLEGEQLGEMMLSYDITIHKSQGSDFPICIVALPDTNMLTRELLYTAVTRAKKKVIIIEKEGMYEQACKNVTLGKRNTNLSVLINSLI